MQQAIGLTDLQSSNGSRLFSQELDSFGLVQDVTILISPHVLEQFRNDSLSTTFRKDKVLSSLELQQHVRLVVVNELDASLLKVLCGYRCFFLKLVAVLFVCQAIADQSHLLDPVRVEVEVFVQAEIGHGPFGSATPFTLATDFDEGYFALLAVLLAFFQEAQCCHAASKTAADDNEVIVCTRSHDVGTGKCMCLQSSFFEMILSQWREARGLLPTPRAGIHIPCSASIALIGSIRAPDVRTACTAGFELIIVCSLSPKCLTTFGIRLYTFGKADSGFILGQTIVLLLTMVTINAGGVTRVQDQRTRTHSRRRSCSTCS